jgi:hypothetical protein
VPHPWRLLLPGVCSSLGWPEFSSSSRYITGAYLLAIEGPFAILFYFNRFHKGCHLDFLDCGREMQGKFQKS